MQQNNKKYSQRKTGKKTSRAGQRPVGRYHYQSRFGPVRAPLMPREFSVALQDSRVESFATSSTYVTYTHGILEPLGVLPKYMSELFRIYKYCRVTLVQVKTELINTGTVALSLVVGSLPFNEVTGASIDSLADSRGSVRRLISPSGGMDRVTVTRNYGVNDIFGNAVMDKYWFDEGQANSASPIDPKEPVSVNGIEPLPTLGPWAATMNVYVTMHCQFFELKADSHA